jgi:hypothetical protein
MVIAIPLTFFATEIQTQGMLTASAPRLAYYKSQAALPPERGVPKLKTGIFVKRTVMS